MTKTYTFVAGEWNAQRAAFVAQTVGHADAVAYSEGKALVDQIALAHRSLPADEATLAINALRDVYYVAVVAQALNLSDQDAALEVGRSPFKADKPANDKMRSELGQRVYSRATSNWGNYRDRAGLPKLRRSTRAPKADDEGDAPPAPEPMSAKIVSIDDAANLARTIAAMLVQAHSSHKAACEASDEFMLLLAGARDVIAWHEDMPQARATVIEAKALAA